MSENKKFNLIMTEKQMQVIANCVTGFLNRLASEGKSIEPDHARELMTALHSFKMAMENRTKHGLIIL